MIRPRAAEAAGLRLDEVDAIGSHGQTVGHLAHGAGRFFGLFQCPAQVNQALAQALARGKTPHQDANSLGQQLSPIQRPHIGQVFQLSQVAPQLLQHHALPFGRHGLHQHLFAGKVLVERANRKTGCGGHFVGRQTGLAFFVQNLSSGLEQGLHGLLRPRLRRLATQAGQSKAASDAAFQDCQLRLTVAAGIPGARWLTEPWQRLPDGAPDPDLQVSILPLRVLDLIWRNRQTVPHPGDTIVADLDLGLANLPPGAAMLHITRVSYLESGAAVELTHSYCRSDYYEFVAESRR